LCYLKTVPDLFKNGFRFEQSQKVYGAYGHMYKYCLKFFCFIACLVLLQSASAQPIKLSDDYPAAGENIKFTYNPALPLAGSEGKITAEVHYMDHLEYPVEIITLQSTNGLWTGQLSIPGNAKAFFIKILNNNIPDNQDGKGYIFQVYSDKKPVEGAYAAKAMILSGLGFAIAKITADYEQAIALYEREFSLYPQSKETYLSSYYYLIARYPSYQLTVNQKIAELETSTAEKDLILASGLLKVLKNTNAADSINAVIKVRFPDGLLVKRELGLVFLKETDIIKKDSLYRLYNERYPENDAESRVTLNNYTTLLAMAYQAKGDKDNYNKYMSQVKRPGLNVDFYADQYAFLLYQQHRYTEALAYEQPVIENAKTTDGQILEHEVLILAAVNEHEKVIQVAELAIKAGHSTPDIDNELKRAYTLKKGSDRGYSAYFAALNKVGANAIKEAILKTIINLPAPDFTLKDIDGKVVNMAAMKGKVVVLDFWATWCGPCRASFPGMELAVKHYAGNPNVKFLFIDTRETSGNYVAEVNDVIKSDHYPFEVLLDEKNSAGKQCKVLDLFGVAAIPTKFVIDKQGNIRFKYTGYGGTPQKLLNEITAMVDTAAKM
jgi:thiol-disulfide isomerase/thioredoxin